MVNILVLHKKGDKSDISNKPRLVYWAFNQIIEYRIAGQLDKNQPVELVAFSPGFSTTDHLHTLYEIIEEVNEINRPLYLAFVDYSAFDSLTHSAIITSNQPGYRAHLYPSIT